MQQILIYLHTNEHIFTNIEQNIDIIKDYPEYVKKI